MSSLIIRHIYVSKKASLFVSLLRFFKTKSIFKSESDLSDAYLADFTPGSPFKALINKPESSAKHDNPNFL